MLLNLLPKELMHCIQNSFLRNSGHFTELVGEHADIVDIYGLFAENLNFDVLVLLVILLGLLLYRVFFILETRRVPSIFEIPANHFTCKHIKDVPGLIKLHVSDALSLGEYIDELRDELSECVQHFVRVLHVFGKQSFVRFAYEGFRQVQH